MVLVILLNLSEEEKEGDRIELLKDYCGSGCIIEPYGECPGCHRGFAIQSNDYVSCPMIWCYNCGLECFLDFTDIKEISIDKSTFETKMKENKEYDEDRAIAEDTCYENSLFYDIGMLYVEKIIDSALSDYRSTKHLTQEEITEIIESNYDSAVRKKFGVFRAYPKYELSHQGLNDIYVIRDSDTESVTLSSLKHVILDQDEFKEYVNSRSKNRTELGHLYDLYGDISMLDERLLSMYKRLNYQIVDCNGDKYHIYHEGQFSCIYDLNKDETITYPHTAYPKSQLPYLSMKDDIFVIDVSGKKMPMSSVKDIIYDQNEFKEYLTSIDLENKNVIRESFDHLYDSYGRIDLLDEKLSEMYKRLGYTLVDKDGDKFCPDNDDSYNNKISLEDLDKLGVACNSYVITEPSIDYPTNLDLDHGGITIYCKCRNSKGEILLCRYWGD